MGSGGLGFRLGTFAFLLGLGALAFVPRAYGWGSNLSPVVEAWGLGDRTWCERLDALDLALGAKKLGDGT